MSQQRAMPAARIVDRGYQHYDGMRLGLTHSLWVMLWAALKRGLGLRRSFYTKIMPWLLIAVAFLPVAIILGIVVITGSAMPTSFYVRLYSSLATLFILFTGLVAPDLICADRRQRVTSLYFASPITRIHYITAQVVSLILLTLTLTLIPFVLIFFGNALLSPAFSTYVSNHIDDLWHVLLTGALMAVFYSTIAMAISSFTDKRAYATGGFLGLMLVSSVAGNVLASRELHFAGHENYILLSLGSMPVSVARWLFGQPLESTLSGWAYLGTALGVIVVSLGLMVWRYQKVGD
jgi:ABC-2 type transport system permease protein